MDDQSQPPAPAASVPDAASDQEDDPAVHRVEYPGEDDNLPVNDFPEAPQTDIPIPPFEPAHPPKATKRRKNKKPAKSSHVPLKRAKRRKRPQSSVAPPDPLMIAIKNHVKLRSIAEKRAQDQQHAEEALEEKELRIQQRISELADQKMQIWYEEQMKRRQKAEAVAVRRKAVDEWKEDLLAKSIARTQAAERRRLILRREREDQNAQRIANEWLKKVGKGKRENQRMEMRERELERDRKLQEAKLEKIRQRRQMQQALVSLSLGFG
jgi:hypothetical protein